MSNLTIESYIENLVEERRIIIQKLRKIILKCIPNGFQETINYGMIGYVVPHTLYPKGYHCDSKLPVPFINLASQKKHIALYHYGIYAVPDLLDWFVERYKEETTKKIDMGKSCIRFKNTEKIPYKLIGDLCSKMTLKEWISIYETSRKSRGKC